MSHRNEFPATNFTFVEFIAKQKKKKKRKKKDSDIFEVLSAVLLVLLEQDRQVKRALHSYPHLTKIK